MSALFGVLHLDNQPVERTVLERMAGSLTSWGPDGARLWCDGPLGLGHRMLHTTAESLSEELPLVRRRGGLILTADARIDNRSELIDVLGLADRPAAEITDSELIAAAYEAWGERCPAKLLGDFAFAIWDAQRQRFFCARDPVGTRPFYYSYSERIFVFGTQIKTLLCLGSVPRRLSEVKLAEYLALLPPDRATTFYRDIFSLPPAHSLTAGQDGVQVRSYWSLDPARELRLASDEEYAEAFRDVFRKSVLCRLRSAYPVGYTLSGGLDSSAIVCTARKFARTQEPLLTFSAVFPSQRAKGRRVDETRYIETIAAGGGMDTHYVRADNSSPLLDFLWQEEEPIPAAALYMDWSIFRAAQQRGVRVLLNGNDGDSVVGYGRGYLAELALAGRWMKLHAEISALSKTLGIGRRVLLRHYVAKPFIPAFVSDVRNRLRTNGKTLYDPRSVIHPGFLSRTGVEDRVRDLLREERPARNERQNHLQSVNSSLLTLLVEIYAKSCAEFSIEPRYPFFDRRLIEFCLALPGDQKLSRGWNRAVMRRAMDGILPPEIQWRSDKQNLTPNFNLRLLEDEREVLESVVYGDADDIGGYIDIPALREKYRRYTLKPLARSRDGFAVFWAVTIALWVRRSGLCP